MPTATKPKIPHLAIRPVTWIRGLLESDRADDVVQAIDVGLTICKARCALMSRLLDLDVVFDEVRDFFAIIGGEGV
jgi:enamine deaminase RidA (YjgF/YER057c/UK114 family)